MLDSEKFSRVMEIHLHVHKGAWTGKSETAHTTSDLRIILFSSCDATLSIVWYHLRDE